MRRIHTGKSKADPAILLGRVEAHQIAAATKPGSTTKTLLGRRGLSANSRARLVNDFLSDPKVN